ncbi:MAG TPA: hypothetical protein VHC69_04115 [Polyangiaceae bacterium]|nr:hypothetical protein [Polyangiaceae bacterium]
MTLAKFHTFRDLVFFGALLSAVGAASCSSDGGAAPGGAGFVTKEPRYGLVTVVHTGDTPTTYVSTVNTLDFTSIDLAEAPEFSGIAEAAASAGKVFVSSGEAPTLSRFSLSDRGEWKNEGTLSFASYMSDSFELENNVFVTADKAYLPFSVASRIVWDPAKLKITGTQAGSPDLPRAKSNLSLRVGYEHAIRGNNVFQPFFWSDDSTNVIGPTSEIVVYDTSTDETIKVLEAPCPMLTIVTEDDTGNVYFSNSAYGVPQRLLSDSAPATSLARIKAGETDLDTDFTVRFTDLTGGHEASTFLYGSNGKGFMAVYDTDLSTITPTADQDTIATDPHQTIWTLDLATQAAAPVRGLPAFGGQPNVFTIDGRTFVLLPSSDYGSTSIYELLSDGSAVQRATATGWVYQMFKIR